MHALYSSINQAEMLSQQLFLKFKSGLYEKIVYNNILVN